MFASRIELPANWKIQILRFIAGSASGPVLPGQAGKVA